MSTMNTISTVGNLVKDPILRHTTTTGKPVANFRIAVNDRKLRNGQWVDDTTFMNVVVFGPQAENAAASLHKGDRVLVLGRIQTREAELVQGERTWFTEILADHVGVSLQFAVTQGIVRTNSGVVSGADASPEEQEALAEAA